MRTAELDFELPSHLIAQTPAPGRSTSRLLHYQKSTGSVDHRTFSDFPDLLRPDDVLVFNNARVLPARFMLRKNTGGKVEGLFLTERSPGRWRVLLRNVGNAKNLEFVAGENLSAVVETDHGGGEHDITVSTTEPAAAVLDRVGRMPLPPYIKRDSDDTDRIDRELYQTVYADVPGSVAAPTAGLHFTTELLARLDAAGIERVNVTLHVGMGTFKPVTVDALVDHPMHTERFEVSASAADALNRAAATGRRLVAVGTTSARVLESYPDQPWQAGVSETNLFVYPPYRFRRVGALLTNFHLPRSTLVALVAAFVGLDMQRNLYRDAIENNYRFFSYGDAMLLE